MGQNASAESEGAQKAHVMSKTDMLPITLNVLDFCDWQTRGHAFAVSKQFSHIGKLDITQRWKCERLVQQHSLYMTYEMGDSLGWDNLFKELYHLRNTWVSNSSETQNNSVSPQQGEPTSNHELNNERSTVKVYVRFKPSINTGIKEDLVNVTLPLHQRMALIKISHGLKTKREVLQVLAKEGSWFGAKWAAARQKKNKNQNSPPKKSIETTAAQPLHAGVQNLDTVFNRLVMVTPDVGMREFMFDGVFPTDIPQKEVYHKVAKRLVMDCLNGFNTTAIVYGQTGSGKTYTMFGADGLASPGMADFRGRGENRGLVYRACAELLNAVYLRQQMNIHTDIGLSYVEVFGDTVTDLLRNGARCGQSKVSAQSYVLTGAVQQTVSSLTDIMHMLQIGEDQKRRAATMMNERSSRAHSILIISLRQKNLKTGVERVSKMFMADLGGSEQVKKSQVAQVRTAQEAEEQTEFSTGFELGERMREAVYINLGLLALKKCIEALNCNSTYVPYQDSKLTMLLSSGLGGNSKTSVIICGTMEPVHAAETLNALRFGEQCSKIEVQARNDAAVLASVLAGIDREIESLEAQIKLKERWEERRENRIDEFAEEGTFEAAIGGKEVKKIYIVVGAETERIRLEQLLSRRAQLTGSDFKLKTKAVAFGKSSDRFGAIYNPEEEEKSKNVRFEDDTDVSLIPSAVRDRKSGQKGWRVAPSDPTKLEAVAKKVNRTKLRFSGISL